MPFILPTQLSHFLDPFRPIIPVVGMQAIGALPPLTSIIMRVMQPETERYTIMVQVLSGNKRFLSLTFLNIC